MQLEVELPVCVGLFTINSNVKFTTSYPGIKEGERSTLLQLHGEFYGVVCYLGAHPYLWMQHVSSTCRFHRWGLDGADLRHSSKNSIYRLATTTETGAHGGTLSLFIKFTTIAHLGRPQAQAHKLGYSIWRG